MPISGSRGLSCLDHSGRYLFCFSTYMRVYDMQTDSLVAACPLPFPAISVTPNPEQGCIYVGCRDVILVYPDAPPGVQEAMNDERGAMNIGASVIRGVLFLPPALLSPPSSLFSVDGRKVLELRPGSNDVRMLAPGVYFLRGPKTEDGRPDAAIRKVVVTR